MDRNRGQGSVASQSMIAVSSAMRRSDQLWSVA